jgi:ATP-dependent DNA ligase
MQRFAETCEAIAATTKKIVKTAIVADYLMSLATEEAAVASVFFSGRPFPVWEEATLQVGGRSLWQIVAELSNRQENELTAAYRKYGDLGAVAAAVLSDRSKNSITLLEVRAIFRSIANARGPSAKIAIARDLLCRATQLEAKYIIKIMTGDLRIGLKESLVEEAIAKAYEKPLPEVQRANMLLGDIGETTVLAAQSQLDRARMRLFHPLGFMLASPIESPEEGVSYFSAAAVEDKYDGIRAQAHISDGEVRIFSRTRDEITESFPELPPVLASIPSNAILDGEIVAWEPPASIEESTIIVDEPLSEPAEEKAQNPGRARPFSALQQRLGRKKVSDKMLRENPVAFLVFDILYADGELLIDKPLRERAQILDDLLRTERTPRHVTDYTTAAGEQGKLFLATEPAISSAAVIRAPVFHATSADELERLFVAARARGNEGLMLKDLNSTYNPGKRGKAWLKIKRELATLDVVVTAVEYGHGKRIGVLSDYTFAVWKGETLVNIGKAYSGLTDAEIAEMTTWFLEHTIEDQGFRRLVEPKIVLEVAFNNMMRSNRHESGYALRFPRIVRLRPDKSAVDADTIERVGKIFEQQT